MENFNDDNLTKMIENRPKFAKRVVVTSGMPYGNKTLHCGHVGGLFVHADTFARFMRDRIGKENVVFVSGTDCYGSNIVESYKKLKATSSFEGSVEDFVKMNHEFQEKTLNSYEVGLDFFGASAFGPAKDNHEQMSKDIFERLKQNKVLTKMDTLQFFDEKANCFLNGRQVIGKCPFENCQSEKAYADECELGHQYMPRELIDPISVVSGEKPVLRKISNWYFDLQDNADLLLQWLDYLDKNTVTRPYVTKEIREFIKKPEIYIKREFDEQFDKIKDSLPKFTTLDDAKSSRTICFESLKDREDACEILTNNGVRFRTGKTLVPFRLTGNVEWGVPVPGEKDQTFWVWPESLWAPISFTKTFLESSGRQPSDYKKWWCSKESSIYQFIGEDNIYFYGPAQHALFLNTQKGKPSIDVPEGNLQISTLVSNKHLLFLNKKASSSSAFKPPMADELLKFYTAEQLRMHFLGLNLGNNSANFMPKQFNPEARAEEADIVLKEGNLLTNVFNKVLRTLFYTWQRHFGGVVPFGKVSDDVNVKCVRTILKYEKLMANTKFHMVTYELDTFIRDINKRWLTNVDENDNEKLKQTIIDCLHMSKVAMVLLHPLVPVSTERLAEFLTLDKSVFSWDKIEKPIYEFVQSKGAFMPKFLLPKQDFFKKHPSQLKELED
jgi:methionyl-tRNA synthetase